jgi:hypothetical protein
VKAIRQGPLVILSQGVDISEHADNGCGDSGLIIAQEATEDKVCRPLAISQLGGRLLLLPFQKIPQVPEPQDNTPSTLNSCRIIKT